MSIYACGIPIRNGKLLLGRRADHRKLYPRCWDVIGGKVEAGETIEMALIRELREELGVTPTRPRDEAEPRCHEVGSPRHPGQSRVCFYRASRRGTPRRSGTSHARHRRLSIGG
jgi:8-oxo-dGTP pyrophosphatase MutT (NUDIX family)